MIGLTHNQFIKLFSDLAIAHKNINSFGTGDLWEYMANESDTINPVTLWVVIQAETLQGKTGKPKYTLVVMDAVDKGQENIDEVYSDTKRIAQDLVSLLRQPYYEGFFTLEQNVVFEPFSEKFDSEMAGHQFDLVFNQPFLYDACEVNIDGLPAVNMDSIYINTSTYAWGNIVGTLSNQTDLQNALNAKQNTLVSGTNIKTINGNSLLGSGNLVINTGVTSVFGRTGAVTAQAGDYTTDQVTEGTNLYYTQARFDTAFGLKSTTNLTEGTNLYYTQARFNTAFSAKSTSDLSEGTNLYFTNARGIGSTLTGYTSGAGTISAADSILSAIQKLNGNTAALVTGVSSVNSLTGAVALTGTSNRITVSAANVFDISASYVGQSSITTVGPLTSGSIASGFTSISNSFTDAKIKGTIAANQIGYGSAADTLTGSAVLTFNGTTAITTNSANAYTVGYRAINSNASGSAISANEITNGTKALYLQMYGTGYTTSGNFRANTAVMSTDGDGGMILYSGSSNANAAIYFYTNAVQVAKLYQTGQFDISTVGTNGISFQGLVGTTTSSAIYLNQSTPSSTNYALASTAAGSTLVNGNGNVILQLTGANRFIINSAGYQMTPGQGTAGTSIFQLTLGNNSSQTAGANVPKGIVTLGSTQWLTGALAQGDFWQFTQPTATAGGASAATNLASIAFNGAPISSTNFTVTNSIGLHGKQGLSLAGVNAPTNGYTAYFEPTTGATNNYSLGLTGNLHFPTNASSIIAAGTGANGLVIKNLKNSANTTVSGTPKTVEIDIAGTPYYFLVYPTTSA